MSGECSVYSFWPKSFSKSIFGVILVIIEYFIPLLILAYCYGKIFWILTRRIESNFDHGTAKTDTFQIARNNTIKTFLLVSIWFVICWSCVQFNYLLYNLGYEANSDWNGTFFKVATLMAFLNCTINPFIYLIKYKDYQIALQELLRCGKHRNTEESENKPSSTFTSKSTLYTDL